MWRRWLAALGVLAAVVLAAASVRPTAGAAPSAPPPSTTTTTTPPVTVPTTSCIGHGAVAANDYNGLFAGGAGQWQGGDATHVYPLPDGRMLWLFNDSFINPTEPTGPISKTSTFVHNAAFVENSSGCVTLLDPAADDGTPLPFLADPAPGQWYWPLGGVVEGDQLVVFFAQMSSNGPLTWQLDVEAVGTVMATYDWRTLTLQDLRPAPDAEAWPFYGYSIASDGQYTYLFGNNLLFGNGTSATYLARVPAGHVRDAPYQYWSGHGWSADRGNAQPVYDSGGYSYALTVGYVAGRWYATTKVDDFYGDRLDILSAPAPSGPWTVGISVTVPTLPAGGQNTYDGSFLPILGTGGTLVVEWSNNNIDYAAVAANPWLYRPTFADVQLPPSMLFHRARVAAVPPPGALRAP